MMNQEMKLMDKLMNAMFQTEEWRRISTEDPLVQQSSQGMYDALKKARAYLPEPLLAELEEAANDYAGKTTYAAVLYGIHIAGAIQAAAQKPELVSQFILERISAGQLP